MGKSDDRIRLLYVDDEPDLSMVVVRALRLDPQLDVMAVLSGAAAIQIVAGGAWRPDVVLLDVMMPDLDGPGTFDRMRELSGNSLPIIFFTAHAQSVELVRLAARGAAGVLIKPFDPLRLAANVRAMIAAWRPPPRTD